MKYRVKSVERNLFLVRHDSDNKVTDIFDTLESAQMEAMGAGMSFIVYESEHPYRPVSYGMKTWSGYVMLDGDVKIEEKVQEMPDLVFEEDNNFNNPVSYLT